MKVKNINTGNIYEIYGTRKIEEYVERTRSDAEFLVFYSPGQSWEWINAVHFVPVEK